jgi:hypothetical protein
MNPYKSPTRFRVMLRLTDEPRSVSELAESLRTGTVSGILDEWRGTYVGPDNALTDDGVRRRESVLHALVRDYAEVIRHTLGLSDLTSRRLARDAIEDELGRELRDDFDTIEFDVSRKETAELFAAVFGTLPTVQLEGE